MRSIRCSGGLLLASGSQQLGASRLTKRRVRYEQIIIDTNYLRFRRRFKALHARLLRSFPEGRGGQQVHAVESLQDAARSVRGQSSRSSKDGFTVAHTENNQPFAAQRAFRERGAGQPVSSIADRGSSRAARLAARDPAVRGAA